MSGIKHLECYCSSHRECYTLLIVGNLEKDILRCNIFRVYVCLVMKDLLRLQMKKRV